LGQAGSRLYLLRQPSPSANVAMATLGVVAFFLVALKTGDRIKKLSARV
jgi:hypothetical protein